MRSRCPDGSAASIAFSPWAPMRRHHSPARDKTCAGLPGQRRQRRIDVGAAIDDRGDRHSGSREIRDGAPAVIAAVKMAARRPGATPKRLM